MTIRVDEPVTVVTSEVDGVTADYVQVVIRLSVTTAEELAAARIARAGADLLADQAKPAAHVVADALVTAGYGSP
jgi:hypothetical protein